MAIVDSRAAVAAGSADPLAAGRPTRVAAFGLVLAAGGLLTLGAAPLGWRLGLWHYGVGFSLLPWAAGIGAMGALIAAGGLLLGMHRRARRAVLLGTIGVALGLCAAVPPLRWYAERGKFPPIHDITTDTDNPPVFTAVLPARAAENAAAADYGGPSTAAAQRKAYPGVAPVTLDLLPTEAFARAIAHAYAAGWTLVSASPPAGGGGRFEASDRSRWFGFTDDIVVRITPQGQGSRVDMRSLSRQGRGDFGANARRVEAFMSGLKTATPTAR